MCLAQRESRSGCCILTTNPPSIAENTAVKQTAIIACFQDTSREAGCVVHESSDDRSLLTRSFSQSSASSVFSTLENFTELKPNILKLLDVEITCVNSGNKGMLEYEIDSKLATFESTIYLGTTFAYRMRKDYPSQNSPSTVPQLPRRS